MELYRPTLLTVKTRSLLIYIVGFHFIRSNPEHNAGCGPWMVAVQFYMTSHVKKKKIHIILRWGTRWHGRLRHWATNQKVASSIPDGLFKTFH